MLNAHLRLRCFLALATVAAASACGDTGGDEGATAVHSRALAITDGVEDTGHRSVGYLAAGDSVGCTGTMVGQRIVLTAGHCISGDSQTFVLDGAEYASESSVIHSKYDPNTHLNDIGILRLERAVHVVPSALATFARGAGAPVTLVGFGATKEGSTDTGTRRRATNTIKSLHTTTFNIAGTGGGKGNVCHRDSGGPVFDGDKGTGPQLGVIIGGVKPCGTTGIAVRVDLHITWLKDKAGASGLAVQGDPGTFGLPCTTVKDCSSGLCELDQASGDRFCSATCDGEGAACPGGGVCVDPGDGPATCQLPAPPELDDTGCSMGHGAGVAHRDAWPGLLSLLALLLVVNRRRR